jgi:hypothetical protein
MSNNLGDFLLKTFNKQCEEKGLAVIKDRHIIFSFPNRGHNGTTWGVLGVPLTSEMAIEKITIPIPPGHPDFSKKEATIEHPRLVPAVCAFVHRSDTTIAHELLHTLALEHTHRNWKIEVGTQFSYIEYLKDASGYKYLFPEKTTSNIMSYAKDNSYTTWHWQWKIMQDNVVILPEHWTKGK